MAHLGTDPSGDEAHHLNLVAAILAHLPGFLGLPLLRGFMVFRVFPRTCWTKGCSTPYPPRCIYAVLVLGAVVALNILGFPLTNLAWWRGLGVGIGFGLQNIVNNFISGLILLFDDPSRWATSWSSTASGAR